MNLKIKFNNYLYLFIGLIGLGTIVACQPDDFGSGNGLGTAPSNLEITATIVGQDAANPNGDGKGIVNFTASASDVITYKYIYDGKETMAPAGEATMTFSSTGVKSYDVTVVAYGAGGDSATETITVEVLVLYVAPEDLLEMLYGDSEKTWRIKAESAGHFGLGSAGETSAAWWSANPNDKAGKGTYDDRITFKSDGTYNYVTNGDIYGQASPLDADFGTSWTANSDNEYENYPVDDFSSSWELSAPSDQETLTFNGKGFHGFYVGGTHAYKIMERSETEMTIRTIGADGNAWYCILTSED
ncbi:PKD domain-containing protein [Aureibaculum sp. A20]|uniref:PKD domain-containing protein n=1 Tax=Aureibaculum flavum TaxID=2795986 RepID=A0ABS0WTH7_9FLAO|nr:PKD domain-containing protein [Aureibaculum flavum]MBJ2175273.1 PKD domain-containing protein [Aureibaculum flavum]